MKKSALFLQFGALLVGLSLVPDPGDLRAQSPAENLPAPAAKADELSPTELLKSYLHTRDALHLTQLAIANNRAESEARRRRCASGATFRLSAAARKSAALDGKTQSSLAISTH